MIFKIEFLVILLPFLPVFGCEAFWDRSFRNQDQGHNPALEVELTTGRPGESQSSLLKIFFPPACSVIGDCINVNDL